MKISIITVCYNSFSTIEDTILSVANQKDVDVEHIVIDGNSTDGTLEIVKMHKSITKFISESDNGIYDAMNKGLNLATGEIVGTLNADDFYMHDNVLRDVVKVFENERIDACYGDLVYVRQDNTDQIIRYWKSKKYTFGLFKAGWMPAHPTFFAKKDVYSKYGGFDLSCRIAADFELLFRFIEKFKVTTVYIPSVLVKMRLGGTTNKRLSNIYKQNKEIVSVLRNYYQDFSLTKFLLHKLCDRFIQFTVHDKNSGPLN